MQERAELGSLVRFELGNARHVTLGLNEQRADPEWSDAMLDEPVAGLVNDAAGQRDPSRGKVAGKTAFHSAQRYLQRRRNEQSPRRRRGLCEVNPAATY